MNSKLRMLPVSGESLAYYVPRESVYLVDGGKSHKSCYQELLSFYKDFVRGDVKLKLICTHADTDHITGLSEVIKNMAVDEVWLPEAFSHTLLPCVQSGTKRVFKDLTEVVDSLSRGSLLDLRGMINGVFNSFYEDEGINEIIFSKDSINEQFIATLSKAQNRIYRLITVIIKKNIPIRWFSYDRWKNLNYSTTKNCGDSELLIPLNSVEVENEPNRMNTIDGLYLLYFLTISNYQSLVFISPQTHEHSGVLFTADSNLDNIKISSINYAKGLGTRRYLVTAPHHGSLSNRKAYNIISLCFPRYTLVKSHFSSVRRLAPEYSTYNKKFCMTCNASLGVSFFDTATGWRVYPHTVPCKC